MMLNKVLVAMAALGGIISPIAVQASATAPISVGEILNLCDIGTRQSTAVNRKNKAESAEFVLAGLGAVAFGASIYPVVDDGTKSNVS